MTPALLVSTATSFLLLAAVFGPLERAFPARRGQRLFRRAWSVDACFFLGQYLLFSGLAAAMLLAVDRRVDAHTLAWLRADVRTLPVIVQGLLALVLGDVVVYWVHRAFHHFDFLWRFHSVHHSSEHLDWLAAHREHPIDGLVTQLGINLPGILMGIPFEAMGPLYVLRGTWAIFIHSNVRLPLGPLAMILGAPELHHWHHAKVRQTAHNFANLAPWLDVLFGTYHRPRPDDAYALGIDGPAPKTWFGHMLAPLGIGKS